MADTPTVLPAAPWYESEVQVRAVIALGFQLVSIIARYLDIPWLQENLDKIIADISQVVAIGFAVLAVTKRKDSSVQPLTLTAKGADTMNAAKPSLLDTDPTKASKL